MTIYYVNTGTGPNAGNGDSLRVAFNKINANFGYIENQVLTGTASSSPWQLTSSTSVASLTADGTLTIPGVIASSNTVTTWTADIINVTTGTYTDVFLGTDEFITDAEDQVIITGVSAPHQVNGVWYYSAGSYNAIQLFHDQALNHPVDSSTWTNYTSGGTAQNVISTGVTLRAGENSWIFTSDGTLLNPANSAAPIQWGGGSYIEEGMGLNVVGIGSLNLFAVDETDPSNPNYSTFFLNTDGSLQFPDQSRQYTAWTGTNQLVAGSAVVSLDNNGTLTVPGYLPVTFTAVLDNAHYVENYGPLVLNTDPWYYTVTFAVNRDGSVETQIDNNVVWPSDAGYPADSNFNFTEADHGIPGYTLAIQLTEVSAGEAGWGANLSASQPPFLAPTIVSSGTVTIRAGSQSWRFNTDGSLTPASGLLGVATSISLITGGPMLGYTTATNVPTLALSGSGVGMTVDIEADGTTISSVTINQPGYGYAVGDTVQINQESSTGTGEFTVESVENLTASTITTPGNIFLTSNTSTWTFGPDGILTLPDGSTLPGNVGSGSIIQSDTAPASTSTSTLWYDTVGGRSYVYYEGAWVDAAPETVVQTTTSTLVNGSYSVSLGSDGKLTLPAVGTIVLPTDYPLVIQTTNDEHPPMGTHNLSLSAGQIQTDAVYLGLNTNGQHGFFIDENDGYIEVGQLGTAPAQFRYANSTPSGRIGDFEIQTSRIESGSESSVWITTQSRDHQWRFDGGGTLSLAGGLAFPDGSSQTTAFNGTASLLVNGGPSVTVDSSGNLISPGNVYANGFSTTGTIVIPNNGVAGGFVSQNGLGNIYFNTDNSLNFIITGTWQHIFNADGTIVFGGGYIFPNTQGTQGQILVYDPDGNGDYTMRWRDQSATTSTLVNGSQTLSLSSTGTLTFPYGASIVPTDGVTIIKGPANGYLALQGTQPDGTPAGSVQLSGLGGSGSVRLVAYLDESHAGAWEFKPDLTLTFPDLSVQSTAWTGTVAYSNVTGVPTVLLPTTGTNYLPNSVNVTGTTSSSATQIMTFTLPSAGTWDVSYFARAVGGGLSSPGTPMSIALYDNSNNLLPNSELYLTNDTGTEGNKYSLGRYFITTNGSSTYKIQGWGNSGFGGTQYTVLSDGLGRTGIAYSQIVGGYAGPKGDKGDTGTTTTILAGTGTAVSVEGNTVTVWTTTTNFNTSTLVARAVSAQTVGTLTNLIINGQITTPVGSNANLVLNPDGLADVIVTTATQIIMYATNTSTSTTTGALVVTGGVGVGGTVTANKFVGDGSSLTNITLSQSSNIIGTGTNVTLQAGSYGYLFDNSGTFTMPYNGDIVMTGTNANLTVGGTVTAPIHTSYSGSWTLSTGTNSVNFSVPGPGTYTLWVNGNIPNGILTYLATVVVTNSNVPVMGSQYGWYYTAGNALVLTSMPNQIVGTVNSISTASFGTTTSWTFNFGITNNSGSSQNVPYGYTRLG